MILPSLTTIRVCFLEMLPLGRQMSFSSTRPMVISSHSKSSRCVGPPFSVRITLNDIWPGPPPSAEYLAVVPRSKGARVSCAETPPGCMACSESKRTPVARSSHEKPAGDLQCDHDHRQPSQSKMENETEAAESLYSCRASSSRSLAFSLAGEITRGVT